MDALLILFGESFARIYAKLRYPNPATDPPRKTMIVVILLVIIPLLAAALAVGVHLLTSAA